MKYELIITCQKGTAAPNWTAGQDRLSWWSPYPSYREILEELIDAGDLSRYVEHDDRTVENDDSIVTHTIYNTLEGATRLLNMAIEVPNCIDATIIERPDL